MNNLNINTFILNPSPIVLSQNIVPVIESSSGDAALTFFPQHLDEDLVLRLLYEQKFIDSEGNWCGPKDLFLPLNSEEIKTIVDDILQKKFWVNGSHDVKFGIQTCMSEIFKFLFDECTKSKKNVRDCEIVGSRVFVLLGLSYIRRCLAKINLPLEKICTEAWIEYLEKNLFSRTSDIDIRFIIPGASIPTLNGMRDKLIIFFSEKMSSQCQTSQYKEKIVHILKDAFPEKYLNLTSKDPKLLYTAIKELMFTKFKTVKSENVTETQYSIVSFGNRDDLIFDLLFVDYLRRKAIFHRNSVRIPLRDWLKGKVNKIVPLSEFLNDGQPILNILANGFSIPDKKTVESADFVMMLSNYTKGQRCLTHGGEEILTQVFIKGLKNDYDPSLYLWNLLFHCCTNHHGGTNDAMVFLVANALRILRFSLSEVDIIKIREKLSEYPVSDSSNFSLHFVYIFHQILSDPSIPLNGIFSLLQTTVFFHMCCLKTEQKEIVLSLTKNSGSPCGMIKCPTQTLGLMLSPQIDLIWEGLKFSPMLFSLYELLLPNHSYAPLGQAPMKEDLSYLPVSWQSMENLCYSEECENPMVAHLRIQYLLCFNSLGFSIDFPFFCSRFLSLLKIHSENKKILKNLIQNLRNLKVFSISETQIQSIEKIGDISQITIEWCSLLFSTSLPALHKLGLDLWKEILTPKKKNEAIIVLETLIKRNPLLACRFFPLLFGPNLLSQKEKVTYCLKIFHACSLKYTTNEFAGFGPFFEDLLQKIASTKNKKNFVMVEGKEILSVLSFLERNDKADLGIELIFFLYPNLNCEMQKQLLKSLNHFFSAILAKDPLRCLNFFSSILALKIQEPCLKTTALNAFRISVCEKKCTSLPTLKPVLQYLAYLDLTPDEMIRFKEISDICTPSWTGTEAPLSLKEITTFPKSLYTALAAQFILNQWEKGVFTIENKEIFTLCNVKPADDTEKAILTKLAEYFIKLLIESSNYIDIFSFVSHKNILFLLLENEEAFFSLLECTQNLKKYSSETAKFLYTCYEIIYLKVSKKSNIHKKLCHAMLGNILVLKDIENSILLSNFLNSLLSCHLYLEICQWITIWVNLKYHLTREMIQIGCLTVKEIPLTIENISAAENVIKILSSPLDDSFICQKSELNEIYDRYIGCFISQKNQEKIVYYLDKMITNDPTLLSTEKKTFFDAHHDQCTTSTKIRFYQKMTHQKLSKESLKKIQLWVEHTLNQLARISHVDSSKDDLNEHTGLPRMCEKSGLTLLTDSITTEDSLIIMDIVSYYQIKIDELGKVLQFSLDSWKSISQVMNKLKSIGDKNLWSIYRQQIFLALLKLSGDDWIFLHENVPDFEKLLQPMHEDDLKKLLRSMCSCVEVVDLEEKKAFVEKICNLYPSLSNYSKDIELDKAVVQACCKNGNWSFAKFCLIILKAYHQKLDHTPQEKDQDPAKIAMVSSMIAKLCSMILGSFSYDSSKESSSSKDVQAFIEDFAKIASQYLLAMPDIFRLMDWIIQSSGKNSRIPQERLLKKVIIDFAKEKKISALQLPALLPTIKFLIEAGFSESLKIVQEFLFLEGIDEAFTNDQMILLKIEYMIKKLDLALSDQKTSTLENVIVELDLALFDPKKSFLEDVTKKFKDHIFHRQSLPKLSPELKENRQKLIDKWEIVLVEYAIQSNSTICLVDSIQSLASYLDPKNQFTHCIAVESIIGFIKKILEKFFSISNKGENWIELFFIICSHVKSLIPDIKSVPAIKDVLKQCAVLAISMDIQIFIRFHNLIVVELLSLIAYLDVYLPLLFILDSGRKLDPKKNGDSSEHKDQESLNADLVNWNDFELESLIKKELEKNKLTLAQFSEFSFEILLLLKDCLNKNTEKCIIYLLNTYISQYFDKTQSAQLILIFESLVNNLEKRSSDTQIYLLMELSQCINNIYRSSDTETLELQNIIIKKSTECHGTALKSGIFLKTHEEYICVHRLLLLKSFPIYKNNYDTYFTHVKNFFSQSIAPYHEKETILQTSSSEMIEKFNETIALLLTYWVLEIKTIPKWMKDKQESIALQWLKLLVASSHIKIAQSFYRSIKKDVKIHLDKLPIEILPLPSQVRKQTTSTLPSVIKIDDRFTKELWDQAQLALEFDSFFDLSIIIEKYTNIQNHTEDTMHHQIYLLEQTIQKLFSLSHIDASHEQLFLIMLSSIKILMNQNECAQVKEVFKNLSVLTISFDSKRVFIQLQDVITAIPIKKMKKYPDLGIVTFLILESCNCHESTSLINETNSEEMNRSINQKSDLDHIFNMMNGASGISDKMIQFLDDLQLPEDQFIDLVFVSLDLLKSHLLESMKIRKCMARILYGYLATIYSKKQENKLVDIINYVCGSIESLDDQFLILTSVAFGISQITLLTFPPRRDSSPLPLQIVLLEKAIQYHQTEAQSGIDFKQHEHYLYLHQYLLKKSYRIYLSDFSTFIRHLQRFVSLMLMSYNQEKETFLEKAEDTVIIAYSKSLIKLLSLCQSKELNKEKDEIAKQWEEQLRKTQHIAIADEFSKMLKKANEQTLEYLMNNF